MVRNIMIIALTSMMLGLSACAELKEVGQTIGHTTRDVTREIGHASRDTAKAIGHATRDGVNQVKEELSQDNQDKSHKET